MKLPGEDEATVIKVGAEATLSKFDWNGLQLVTKRRTVKRYRDPRLDLEIRLRRTLKEARLIHAAKGLGVPCPALFLVDRVQTTLYMQWIEGVALKEVLADMTARKLAKISGELGRCVARMHEGGIVHGDMTTSNVILDDRGQIFFVDFGLGDFGADLEEKAIDIHLMRRALESSHYSQSKMFLEGFLVGYSEVSGDENLRQVLKRVEEVRGRGRYVEKRRRQ